MKKRITGASELSLARFIARARRATKLEGKVHVLLTSSGEMQRLNREFRGKNKPTDVLSFPSAGPQISRRSAALPVRVAGDIAVSTDIAADNAKSHGHSTLDEIKILILHGMLHLAGYDHEADDGEMASREEHLRRELKLSTGLIARNHSANVYGKRSRSR